MIHGYLWRTIHRRFTFAIAARCSAALRIGLASVAILHLRRIFVGIIDCRIKNAIIGMTLEGEDGHAETERFCGVDRGTQASGAATCRPGLLAERGEPYDWMRSQFGHALVQATPSGRQRSTEGAFLPRPASDAECRARQTIGEVAPEGRDGQWVLHRAVDSSACS